MRVGTAVQHALGIAGVSAGALLAFLPILGNEFVNWDDPVVFLRNAQLGGPDTVRWAFTTTDMGHYQPLSWLVWSAVKTSFGLNAQAFHAISLLGHLLNTVLVYVVCLRLASHAGLEIRTRRLAALAASLLFAVHPIQVEAVAWASAFPYVLSLSALLAAFLAYVTSRTHRNAARRNMWLGLSISAYAASLLARATAVGFPLLLLATDIYPLQRLRWQRGGIRRLLVEKLPFFAVALAAGAAESGAREVAPLQEIGVGARLSMAAAAPFIYLHRALVPTRLSPLDPLPIEPTLEWMPLALGIAGLVATTVVAWKSRRTWPALPLAWVAYVVLLAPVMGLIPSGQQATADRYIYLPGVVVALIAGVAAARAAQSARLRAVALAVTLTVGAILGAMTRHQTGWWRDSITLWSRAADLDPRNDIATFNLAIALEEAGREEEAIVRYEQTLRLVPDQTFARQNLGRIRATRGMTLAKGDRLGEAAAELRAALDADVSDPEVPNALAFALVQTGRSAEAVTVLKRAVARHPDDLNLTHNLARLLATSPDAAARDGDNALRLALEVRDRTGARDPRVLDTLAAAYAAVGRIDLARETAAEAAALARQLGDPGLAGEIAEHGRRYQRPP
jgi:Flp pilus assembly protein TadD